MTDPEVTFESLIAQLSECPDVEAAVLDHCRERYEAVKAIFVDEAGAPLYLTRDNAQEGMEEAADGINYAVMESLKRAAVGKEERRETALSAAHHFALAYLYLARLQSAE